MRGPVKHYGYYQESGPTPMLQGGEADTSTCGHCQQVTYVRPPVDGKVVVRLGRCGCCHRPVCEECSAKASCTPWEKRLEEIERRGAMLKAIGVES